MVDVSRHSVTIGHDRCGKLWDVQHVLREAPGNFNRQGAIIRACPHCHGTEPDGMTEKERIRLRAIAASGEHLGTDDLERLVAAVDDLKTALKAEMTPRED